MTIEGCLEALLRVIQADSAVPDRSIAGCHGRGSERGEFTLALKASFQKWHVSLLLIFHCPNQVIEPQRTPSGQGNAIWPFSWKRGELHYFRTILMMTTIIFWKENWRDTDTRTNKEMNKTELRTNNETFVCIYRCTKYIMYLCVCRIRHMTQGNLKDWGTRWFVSWVVLGRLAYHTGEKQV